MPSNACKTRRAGSNMREPMLDRRDLLATILVMPATSALASCGWAPNARAMSNTTMAAGAQNGLRSPDPAPAMTVNGVSTMPGFISNHPRARELIRIGDDAIARENPAMLRAYMAEDFIFHGSGGDLNFEQLSGYFASVRAALSDFRLVREQILVEGDYMAARNAFAGVFTGVFTQSPIGALEPTGKPVSWEVINTFRFNAEGRLAEEWAQTDYRSMLETLGAVQG